MRQIIFTALCFTYVSMASHGAIVSAGIQGTIDTPTITGLVELGDLSYAALIVDGTGNGIEFLAATTITEGLSYGTDNYVAAVFASTNSFFGVAAASPVASVFWDDTLGESQAETGDTYYVIWFEGTAGAADDADTSFSVVASTKYWYATGVSWTVGTPGGSTVPSSTNTGFNSSIVPIPEPSAALLGALGTLVLLRRRRN